MTTPELPPLPPLGRFSQDFHRMRVMQDGAWCPYDDVKAIDDAREARECILVAEIERLRASLQIEKDAAALSYKNGMALGEQLHDCQCTVRELRAEVEAMRWPAKPTPAMRDALRTGSRRDVPSDELCAVRYAALMAARSAP